MHDHDSAVVSSSRPRWTEDRVERLLISIFAESPSLVVPPTRSPRNHGTRNALLVAVAAACLAVIVPILSVRVDEFAGNQRTLARWVGPMPVSNDSSINLASSDESESMSDESSNSSAAESDETAEAPGSTESEESAST